MTVLTARLGRELGLTAVAEVPNCAAEVFDAPVMLLLASSERLATPFLYPAVRAL